MAEQQKTVRIPVFNGPVNAGPKHAAMSKAEAARVLEDEICDIRRWTSNADCVAQELTEEYFGKPTGGNPQERNAWILYGYERAGAFADILQDILFKLHAAAEKLEGYQKGAE